MPSASGPQHAATGLLHTGEKRSTLVYWPEVVDEQLNELQQLIMATGEQASRAQILAALVLTAVRDGEYLARMIRSYRQLGVAEASPPPASDAGRRRPGPRQPGGASVRTTSRKK